MEQTKNEELKNTELVISIDNSATVNDLIEFGTELGLFIGKSKLGWMVREVKVQ